MTIPVPKSRDQRVHVIPKVVVMDENEVYLHANIELTLNVYQIALEP